MRLSNFAVGALVSVLSAQNRQKILKEKLENLKNPEVVQFVEKLKVFLEKTEKEAQELGWETHIDFVGHPSYRRTNGKEILEARSQEELLNAADYILETVFPKLFKKNQLSANECELLVYEAAVDSKTLSEVKTKLGVESLRFQEET